MKRLSFVIVLSVLLAACGPAATPQVVSTVAAPANQPAAPTAAPTQAAPTKVEPTQPATTPVPPTATVPPTPAGPQVFKIGDIVKIGDSVLLVLGWRDIPEDKFSKPDAGQKFIAVDVILVNASAEPLSVSSMMQVGLKDETGQKYDTDLSASVAAKQDGIDGTLMAGERVRGAVAYQVPVEVKGVQFVFDASLFDAGKVFVDLGETPQVIDPPAQIEGETAQPVKSLGEAIKSGPFEITVNSATEPKSDKYTKPAKGHRFIAIDVTLVNQADKATMLSSDLQMWLKDATGQRYKSSLSATMAAGKAPSGEIAVGEKVRGQVGFEIPADLTGWVFVFDGDLFGADKVNIALP